MYTVQPKFHVFERFAERWPGVNPGDVIISPDAMMFKYDEFMERDEDTRCVIVKKRPLLVLARIDEEIGQKPYSMNGDRLTEDDMSTFVLYSISMGFLIALMPRR